ncbi:MAG: type II toxin-antitoxin system RelE/ParE family toxin [Firmicutes bacterium]|nr:type II toxin-antitoxin system RelE/ParE family toxin [Bacillota bacterium]
MKKIETLFSAEVDIASLYNFIYPHSSKNAENQVVQIREHIKMLGNFPGLCMPLTNKVDFDTDLKYSISVPYVIITKHFDTHIEVHRVFHGKENYINKLFV